MSQKTDVYVSRHFRSVAVVTLMSSLVWTVVSIYAAATKNTQSSIPAELLKPITATLDAETLTTLAQKRQLTDELKDLTLLEATIVAPSPKPASINEVSTPIAVSTPSAAPVNNESSL